MVTLLLAWSAGVAGGERDEGGDQGTQGSILCYQCENRDGTCSEEETGDIIECPSETGCYIYQLYWYGGDMIRRCGEAGDRQGCNGHIDSYECTCNTPLCNKNLETAGAGDMILCYECNGETCTDQVHGDTMHCPAEGGCFIRQLSEYDDAWRTCGGGVPQSFECHHANWGTECTCDTPLCNENLDTAGADTILCYQCAFYDETCTDQVHGDTMHCAIEDGCYILQHSDDMVVRECGSGKVECHHGDSTYCQCDTPLCNENLDTAGWGQINKDSASTTTATSATTTATATTQM